MTSPIRRVARFGTGTVDSHPQHAYRGCQPMYWWMLTSREWQSRRPINVYVIEHTDGIVLFDTGQDRKSVTERSSIHVADLARRATVSSA
jgi:N-acyl homoserine lactone hydrolase